MFWYLRTDFCSNFHALLLLHWHFDLAVWIHWTFDAALLDYVPEPLLCGNVVYSNDLFFFHTGPTLMWNLMDFYNVFACKNFDVGQRLSKRKTLPSTPFERYLLRKKLSTALQECIGFNFPVILWNWHRWSTLGWNFDDRPTEFRPTLHFCRSNFEIYSSTCCTFWKSTQNSCHHFEAMSATIESVDNPLYNKWLDTRTFVNLMLTGRQICNVRPGPGARHFDMLDQLFPGISLEHSYHAPEILRYGTCQLVKPPNDTCAQLSGLHCLNRCLLKFWQLPESLQRTCHRHLTICSLDFVLEVPCCSLLLVWAFTMSRTLDWVIIGWT